MLLALLQLTLLALQLQKILWHLPLRHSNFAVVLPYNLLQLWPQNHLPHLSLHL